MNLPTKITVARLALIPVFIVLYLIPFPYHTVIATAVFIVASLTDWLDGYLARKNNMVTTLGKFLHPVADKVLVACALVLAAVIVTENTAFQTAIIVCTVIILARELIITCFRTIAATKNVIMAADTIGKLKTTTQLIGLIFYMSHKEIYLINSIAGDVFFYAGFAFLMIATVLTIVSAINYIVRNRSVLTEDHAE